MSNNERAFAAARIGSRTNSNGGSYKQGRRLCDNRRFDIAFAIQHANEATSLSSIAREHKVSRSTVQRIKAEVEEHGRLLTAVEKDQERTKGVGVHVLDEVDDVVLFMLYQEEPGRSRSSYVDRLEEYTGNCVSESTISRWFNKAFPIKGSLVKANVVPRDKLRPANMLKAQEYLTTISFFHPERLKFSDEKLLKGAKVYCRQTRRNVMTGEVPANIVNSDFRNTYVIIGFCGVDPTVTPLRYNITDASNNSETFRSAVEGAIALGFLKPGDVLVLDNAPMHLGGENVDLEEFLWVHHRIWLLTLPTRTPEWNPIEQVWKVLVRRIKKVPMGVLRGINNHAPAHAAADILSKITHSEVRNMYRHCGINVN